MPATQGRCFLQLADEETWDMRCHEQYCVPDGTGKEVGTSGSSPVPSLSTVLPRADLLDESSTKLHFFAPTSLLFLDIE